MPRHLLALRPDELSRLLNAHSIARFCFHICRQGLDFMVLQFVPTPCEDRQKLFGALTQFGSRLEVLAHMAIPELVATSGVKLLIAGITTANGEGADACLVPCDMTSRTLLQINMDTLLDFLQAMLVVSVKAIQSGPHSSVEISVFSNWCIDQFTASIAEIRAIIRNRLPIIMQRYPDRKVVSIMLHLETTS